MLRRLAFPVLFLVVACVPRTAHAQDSAWQALLDSARTSLDIPGASAALLLSDGTSWSGASGLASPGISATVATAFELGSVTKVYTAALVLALAANGQLGLDDAVARWFPTLPGAESITVRQLLNHTHGLHDPLQEPDFIPGVLQNPTRRWTLDDVLDRMGDPLVAPGTGWQYSNTGYHLLGGVVEAVTGASFRDALGAHLLTPLDLRGTWYGPDNPPGVSVAAAYIDPTGTGTPQPVSLLMPWTAFRTSAGPAGAMVATAEDVVRFLHILTTGDLLPEDEWTDMTTWVHRPDGHRHGLGLLRIEFEERPLLGHKGNAAGYSASAFHDPSTGATAVVLTNAHAVDVTPIVIGLLRSVREREGSPQGTTAWPE